MTVFVLDKQLIFPAPQCADENGLLAVGGDLSTQRLLLAYSCGIFPWNHPSDPTLWWSPNPRCVLHPEQVHISRSMTKKIAREQFKITFDMAFNACILHCAECNQRAEQTWISQKIVAAYNRLHKRGYAHSVECWQDDELVGGLYGLALGRCFCGESMFHTQTDASKMAFIALAQHLLELDYQLIDCQLPTDHLHSLGAYDIDREQFLHRLEQCQPKVDGNVVAGKF
ncbi:MAG: leucyl/phenylalanyl-tRNA--protein transferase [Desulfobacteraceae bacterium 4572_35.1]|nr:MAG: leucyl/phenylalanyl-tRNA--protein transferase [Desulfobacteraceae bacterium 4572_35.1]